MKNKKIAFLTPIYLPAHLSGSGVVVQVTAEELAKKGYSVHVITSNAHTPRYWYDPLFGKRLKTLHENINGVNVTRLQCNYFISSVSYILVRKFSRLLPAHIKNKLLVRYNGPYLINLEKVLREENFDIIHCSPFPMNINYQLYNTIQNSNKKPKTILTPFYHSEVKEFHNPELKNILELADSIHVISQAEKEELIKRFKIDESKVIVIPLFLPNHAKISVNKKDLELFNTKFNLHNKKVVLFAGNKGYMKGALTLIDAVSQLFKKNSSIRLITIGNSMPEWERYKKRYGKGFLMDFDYVDEKTKKILFSVCDIFCMPSISETFGIVYLEAWEVRKPVIGADIPAVRELLSKKAGIVIKFGDSKELASTIDALLKNKKRRDEIGMIGYKKLSEYTIEKYIASFINVIERL